MKLTEDWRNKDLQCLKCGEKRSVKYEYEGESYCNKCMAIVMMEAKRNKK